MREEKYTDMSLTDEQASLLGFKSFSESEQYIQVKDVRYTLDEFNRVGDFLLGWELTDDQQVVLDYLIKQAERCSDIGYLVGDLNFFASTEDGKAWAGLTEKERYQVLAAFAEWGMEQEEE